MNKIGLIIKKNSKNLSQIIRLIEDLLIQHNSSAYFLESDQKYFLKIRKKNILSNDLFFKTVDFIIVVGGDGTMLTVARQASEFNVPLIGINKGGLGFLADIKPDELQKKLKKILDGKFIKDKRILLLGELFDIENKRLENNLFNNLALNEISIIKGSHNKLIELEVFMKKKFIFNIKSDGLIISTPTGSTAYAMSAGGPIIYPSINAILLVPISPHTLTNRPIVLPSNTELNIVLKKGNTSKIFYDNHYSQSFSINNILKIKKNKNAATFLHPEEFSYFSTLTEKLNWSVD